MIKEIFLATLFVLCVASLITMGMRPEGAKPGVKTLCWTTDSNPAREIQVKGFRDWLAKRGEQEIDLRLDVAGAEFSKKIIQGISGVASDLVDCYPQQGELGYLVQCGMVEPLDGMAAKQGFSLDKTYAALRDDLLIDGHQYAVPCSANAPMLFVNRKAFEELGLEAPPPRWSFADFERRGAEYVRKANEGQARRERFFCSGVPPVLLARSLGADLFNETLTKSGAASPGFVETFRLLSRWTYELHLLPSASEMASFATQSGYGGATFQLFNNGNFAMTYSGRYALIQFRQFGVLDLDVCEPPNGGFPNTLIGARSLLLYKGSPNKKEAALFLQYLFSEEYNTNIVEDADSLPPNPLYLKTEAYLRPPAHPNEWRVHSKFANEAVAIGIVSSKSPYVSNSLAYKMLDDAHMTVMSQVSSPEAAAAALASRLDGEIARNLKDNPALAEPYAKALAAQSEIERRLAAGQKIPSALIANPFHRKYYATRGLLE
jgi:multiple sugar transport system substrate-binding protein